MSADKVVQKIVITHIDDDVEDNVEPINAVITAENGAPVATVDKLPVPIIPDQQTITDDYGRLSVKLSQVSGHKNISAKYDGLSVLPAELPNDLPFPDDASTTVTPEQFNQLLFVVESLLTGLKEVGLVEHSKG